MRDGIRGIVIVEREEEGSAMFGVGSCAWIRRGGWDFP